MGKAQDKLDQFLREKNDKLDKLVEANMGAKKKAGEAADKAFTEADAVFSEAIKAIEDEIIALQDAALKEEQGAKTKEAKKVKG